MTIPDGVLAKMRAKNPILVRLGRNKLAVEFCQQHGWDLEKPLLIYELDAMHNKSRPWHYVCSPTGTPFVTPRGEEWIASLQDAALVQSPLKALVKKEPVSKKMNPSHPAFR